MNIKFIKTDPTYKNLAIHAATKRNSRNRNLIFCQFHKKFRKVDHETLIQNAGDIY